MSCCKPKTIKKDCKCTECKSNSGCSCSGVFEQSCLCSNEGVHPNSPSSSCYKPSKVTSTSNCSTTRNPSNTSWTSTTTTTTTTTLDEEDAITTTKNYH